MLEELEAHKANLRQLRKQNIKFGTLHAPLYLLNAMKDEEEEITRIKKMLGKFDE